MSYSYSKSSYSTSTAKSSSPSQAIEDPKKKTSLLKDRSWIRSNTDQEEAVDQDPNFGRVVLNKYRSNEALDSAEPADSKSPQTTTTKTLSSVEALKKRFGGSQDELSKGSTLPTFGRTSTAYAKSTSPPKSDSLKTTTVSKTTVTEEPKKTSTTTTITTKGGTTTETTISTSQSVSRSPVVKSPTTNTESFTDRVFNSRKGTENQLVSSLKPTSVKTEYLIPDSTTSVSKTDTVTQNTTKKESTSGDGRKKPPTAPKRTSSKTEDDLFDTLLPTTMNSRYSSPTSTTTITNKEVVTVDSPKGDVKTVKSPTSTTRTITSSYSRSDDVSSTRSSSHSISSLPSEDYTSTNTRRSYSSKPDSSEDYTSTNTRRSYSSNPDNSEDYTSTNTRRSYSSKPDSSVSVTSPMVYTTSTTYKDSSRADDDLFDSLMSKPSKTVYSTPERTVLERDLCSYCRKPMSSDPKMVLEDMKINCHTTCFKCEVCSSDLGHLKAGDSMWVYRRTVHCERCFEVTREKWHR
ncbi:sciellin isoform X2 [Salvelinus fontinalis]|uniref:sciellin isoform X2 n=1 Tax=Salvelinus fontinalis TaxID=8038 RepID=UPI0024861A8A|nr:sciellin isoform X2 [Salvelinus fontinalis]